jgi:O-antigen/teichoic acid export membrane protein
VWPRLRARGRLLGTASELLLRPLEVRGAFAWSVATLLTVLSIDLGGLVVLSRLLRPAEVGSFAAALAFVQVCQFLALLELNTFVLRCADLGRTVRGRIVGICTLSGLASSGLAAALTFLLPGAILGEVSRDLLLLMSPVPLIAAFNTVSLSLLTRRMLLRAAFLSRVLNSIVFQGFAICTAAAGFGATSLAAALVSATFLTLLVATWLTRGALLVQPVFSGAEEILGFARTFFSATIVQRIGEGILPVLVGAIGGYAALGIFTRASDLVRQASRVVVEGAQPVLGALVFRLPRDHSASKAAALRALANLSALCWPVAGLVCIWSEPTVRILLGRDWLGVAPLLAILATGLAVVPVISILTVFMLALRRERLLLTYQTALQAASIAAAVLAAISIELMCVVLVLLRVVYTASLGSALAGILSVRAGELWHAVWRSVVLTLAVGVPGFVTLAMLTREPGADLGRLLAGAVAALVIWLRLVLLLRHPLSGEITAMLGAAAVALGMRRPAPKRLDG